MAEQRNIVIIGSGMAGYTLLREMRKLNTDIDITLLCADSGDFYSKPMLSNALAVGKTPHKLVAQTAQAMRDAQHFELIPDTGITAIDSTRQTISSGSQSWRYQQLVLAVGANPFKLPIPGDGAQDILSVNHLDDYRRFHQRLQDARHVAIIGPGLIGCEFANDLLSAAKQVSVIGPDHWPISTLLPEKSGRFLQGKLSAAGIGFYLNNSVQSVTRANAGYELQLKDDQRLRADLVLSAVGLRANLALAEGAGLHTGRAYLTDRLLQTSVANIHALGDCAEVEGLHLPFILPIMQCARALAKTLTGTPTAVKYPPMPVAIKTPACPVVVAAPPLAEQPAQWRYTASADGIKALAYRDDALVGFALAGDCVSEKQVLNQSLPALL